MKTLLLQKVTEKRSSLPGGSATIRFRSQTLCSRTRLQYRHGTPNASLPAAESDLALRSRFSAREERFVHACLNYAWPQTASARAVPQRRDDSRHFSPQGGSGSEHERVPSRNQSAIGIPEPNMAVAPANVVRGANHHRFIQPTLIKHRQEPNAPGAAMPPPNPSANAIPEPNMTVTPSSAEKGAKILISSRPSAPPSARAILSSAVFLILLLQRCKACLVLRALFTIRL